MTTLAIGKSKPPRGAFSLFEVLLVLTLLVIVAALVAPGLGAGSARSRMKQAAEQVRTAWSQARLDAVAAGETLRFQCRIGSGHGFVATAARPAEDVETGLAVANPSAGARSDTNSSEYELSEVVFRQVLVSQQQALPPTGGNVTEGDLSAPVLFFPDGTTSTAEAVIEDAAGRRLRVKLRGLTGTTKIEEVGEER